MGTKSRVIDVTSSSPEGERRKKRILRLHSKITLLRAATPQDYGSLRHKITGRYATRLRVATPQDYGSLRHKITGCHTTRLRAAMPQDYGPPRYDIRGRYATLFSAAMLQYSRPLRYDILGRYAAIISVATSSNDATGLLITLPTLRHLEENRKVRNEFNVYLRQLRSIRRKEDAALVITF